MVSGARHVLKLVGGGWGGSSYLRCALTTGRADSPSPPRTLFTCRATTTAASTDPFWAAAPAHSALGGCDYRRLGHAALRTVGRTAKA